MYRALSRMNCAFTLLTYLAICGCESDTSTTPTSLDADLSALDMMVLPADMTMRHSDARMVDASMVDARLIDSTLDIDSTVAVDMMDVSDAAPPLQASVQNVLLIVADDLGLDAIHGFGFTESIAQTPVIDTLCNDGLRFLSAYAHPTCSPTRASILTGRYPFRTGIGGPVGGVQPGLDLDETILPELLDEHLGDDVSHAVIGKWHLADVDNGQNESPNRHGFQHYAGLIRGVLPDYWSWEKVTNGLVSQSDTYATTDTVNDAIEWLDGRENPWFLMVAFSAPHTPLHVPPNLLHHSSTLEEGPCPVNKNYECFMAMIEAMDTEMGRLLASLNETQRANTQIFFVGDNGTANGVLKGYPSRTGKDTLFEGGVHVPMCSQGPAIMNSGRTTAALTNVTDLFPTTLELMGAEPNPNVVIDGRSLRPLLMDQAESIRDTTLSELGYSMNNRTQLGRALRDPRYTLIRFESGDQFFDRETDPFEQTNLLDGTLTEAQEIVYQRLAEQINELQ